MFGLMEHGACVFEKPTYRLTSFNECIDVMVHLKRLAASYFEMLGFELLALSPTGS